MTRRYDFITFDCYGTLIDWENGISKALASAAVAAGFSIVRSELLDAYHAEEPVVEAERYRSYRDVLTETAVRVASRFGWSLTVGEAQFLAASLPSWQPFSDTNRALERIAESGVRLGILSNVDDDLIEETQRNFTVRFDLVITAQQVGSYKPAHGHFHAAVQALGDNVRWLHAAQSYVHDVVPCRELDIEVAWINRKEESPSGDSRPDAEFLDLTSLANWIAEAH